MTTPAWRAAACNHPPAVIMIGVDRCYCQMCELHEQILGERRDHRQQLIRIALEKSELEDRVCTLEEMLRLSEGLRQREGGRDEA